jgi:hypothetical protein
MRYPLSPVRLARVSFAAGALACLFVLWGALGLSGEADASLPANCSESGLAVTCSFFYTGAEQSFAVPAGVSSVSVAAVGGAGGDGGDPGGLGGTAAGSVSVLPGSTLYVEVAGTGAPPGSGGGAGYNGGGSSSFGGSGGGASDVRTVPCALSGCPGSSRSLASRLVVAAGGGGSAQYGSDPYGDLLGGTGGAAGSDGAPGVAPDLAGIGAGGGGGAGTATTGAGGAGGGVYAYDPGVTPGDPGTSGGLGQGGAGGAGWAGQDGGGGGGGYYGGGGGGGGGSGSGGGGGGGFSWVEPGATGASTGIASSGVPASVTITYTAPTGCTMTSTAGTTAFNSSGQSIQIENTLSSDLTQTQYLVLRSTTGPARYFGLTSATLTGAACIDYKTHPTGPGDAYNTFAGEGTGVYGTSYGTSSPGYTVRIEIGDYGAGTGTGSVGFSVTNSSGAVVWSGRGTLTSGSETETG